MNNPDVHVEDANHAVEVLAPAVAAIANNYESNYRDDIAQACWLAILKLVNDGCESGNMLVTRARYAASDEYKAITGHGFRPHRTKLATPPDRVFTNWVGNCAPKDSDDEWVEPTYLIPDEDTSDLFEELLACCFTLRQRMCVKAAQKLVDAVRRDKSETVKLQQIADLTGLTRFKAFKSLHEVFEIYDQGPNRD